MRTGCPRRGTPAAARRHDPDFPVDNSHANEIICGCRPTIRSTRGDQVRSRRSVRSLACSMLPEHLRRPCSRSKRTGSIARLSASWPPPPLLQHAGPSHERLCRVDDLLALSEERYPSQQAGENSGTGSENPFSLLELVGSNTRSAPVHASLTSRDTRIASAWAISQIRAAICTAEPKRS
jgi:hypothetical protein